MALASVYGYAAVRRGPDGVEWLDLSSIASVEHGAVQKVVERWRADPAWAQEHPVVRYARIVVEEVKP